MSSSLALSFSAAAREWIVDGGSLSIRFLAAQDEGVARILDASLDFGPREIPSESDFIVQVNGYLAGQKTFTSLSRAKSLSFAASAIEGEIDVGRHKLRLLRVEPNAYYSDMFQRERWEGSLHLQVSGESWRSPHSALDALALDNQLRSSTPPFDGLNDLCQWLGLKDSRASLQAPAIGIRIRMPVDLIFSAEALRENRFRLDLIAHNRCDLKKMSVALRAFPGDGVRTRRQVGSSVKWRRHKDGFKRGLLDLNLAKSDSVQVLLTYAGHMVRRQWFLDPDKATNTRLLATQTFDRELKQLRQALLESTDSGRFEQGVAALLFLLGFSPSPILETQAPDILLVSPNGAIAIVECTTRIADFAAKVGKLVDRRQTLVSQLEANGHAMRVLGFLVTSQTRAQIAAEVGRLAALNILLLTREDITEGLARTRLPVNPDSLLDDAAKQLAAANSALKT